MPNNPAYISTLNQFRGRRRGQLRYTTNVLIFQAYAVVTIPIVNFCYAAIADLQTLLLQGIQLLSLRFMNKPNPIKISGKYHSFE